MTIKRPLLFALSLIFLAGGLFVMASASPENVVQSDGIYQIDPSANFGITPIGGGPGCFTVCTDGCPGICRTCCDVNGTLVCTTFSNGCTIE